MVFIVKMLILYLRQGADIEVPSQVDGFREDILHKWMILCIVVYWDEALYLPGPN